jgi:cell division septation protein DedD
MSYQFGHVDPDERLDYAEDEVAPEETYHPPRRHLSGTALALGVMAIFAGGLWFAYHEGTKHPGVTSAAPADNIPLIRADNTPVKVKPDKAGGMEIPDQDNPLYGAKSSAPIEKLLPPPEALQPRPVAPVAQPQPQPAGPAVAPAAPAAASPKPAPPLLTPAQIAALAKPPVASATPAPGEAAVPDGVKVQLASLRTPDEARDEWARLKHENPDLLGKLTAVAVRADLGEKGIYYKIEAGPLGSKADAVRLCSEMKQRDLGCQLVR